MIFPRTSVALLVLLTSACTIGWRTELHDERKGGSLLAAVEVSGGIELLSQASNRSWTRLTTLPASARALRFTSAGDVFWLQDELHGPKPVSLAFVRALRGGASPQPLPPEAVPLIVRMPHDSALPAPGDVRIESDCLVPSQPALCGTALRLLDWEAPSTLLVATNAEAVARRGPSRHEIDLAGVVDGRLTRDGALLVHRVDSEGVVMDAISRWDPHGHLQELLRAAVVIWVDEDTDGSLLAVRRSERHDLYEALLAHAPEEFGGEALGGEAIRVDARSGREAPIPGLEGRSVRAVVALGQGEAR